MFQDKVSGSFELTVRDAETGAAKRHLSFNNLILNSGLNGYFTNDFASVYCAVGNGTSTPSVTDTSLNSPVAYSGNPGSWSSISPVAPDYVAEARCSFRFAAGSINGNITEIGVCNSKTGANIKFWCRALILDEQGQPTTLTVLSNEYLDVVYILRLHPDLTDKQFNLVIDGASYDCVSRLANATRGFGTSAVLADSSSYVAYAYATQELGAITGLPNGAQYTGPQNATALAYQMNSYKIQTQTLWGLDQGNIPGGIGSMVIMPGSVARGMRNALQVSFTPKLPKDNTIELRFTVERSLARYTP